MKVDKNGLWEIISWKQYVNYARIEQTIPTYSTHLNQLLETARRQGYAQLLITFKDMMKRVYFDSTDILYNMYKEEYK